MTFRQTVPAFLGGISQQSKELRPTNLVDDAVNIEHIPSEGATKRYPTEWLSEVVETMDGSKVKVVAMNRDDQDFLVVFDGSGQPRVFDALGVEQAVTAGAPSLYLQDADHEDIRTQQVADTLFIANRTEVVDGQPGKDYASWVEDTDIGVFVKQSNYGVTYTLNLNSNIVEVETQGSAANYTFRNYDEDAKDNAVQVWRITAGQAAGTDPIYLNDPTLTRTVEFNESEDLDIRRFTGTVITGTSIPPATGGLAMVSEPASGHPTTLWNIDCSDGNLFDPRIDKSDLEVDVDYQAIFLPAGVYSAGDWMCLGNRRAEARQNRLSPTYVARKLAEGLEDAGYSIQPAGYTDASKEDFSSSFRAYKDETYATLSLTNTEDEDYATAWKESVEEITDLPLHFTHGAIVQVKGLQESLDDDYYVEFALNTWRDITRNDESQFDNYQGQFGEGGWRETVRPGLADGNLNRFTMPHKLQRAADGTWRYDTLEWSARSAGDDLSAPEPSFVGGRILDVFYHEDRLGFSSDANVIMSQSGELLNFWRTTVLSTPASDPVDITVAATQGDAVYHVLPFDQRLFAFTENAQIGIDGGQGPIGPATITARVLSNFRSSPAVSPVVDGTSLFAPYRTGNSMQLREMFPGQYRGDLQDMDTTMAVPRLVGSNLRKVVASGSGDVLLFGGGGEVYLYQYLRQGSQYYMNAWGRWSFDGTVLDGALMADRLYLLIQRGSVVSMESVEMGAGRGDTSTEFAIRMDQQSEPLAVSWTFAEDQTTVEAPFSFESTDDIVVVSLGPDLERGTEIPVIDMDAPNSLVVVSGNYENETLLVGRRYESSLVMSRPVPQVPSQAGSTALLDARALVREFTVTLTDTGYLRALVEAVGQADSVEEFLADRTDVGELNPGSVSSREFTVPIHASNDEFRLTLTNPTPLPATLVSGGWAMRVSPRYSQR